MMIFPYGLFAAAGVGCMLIALLLSAPKHTLPKGTITIFGLLSIPKQHPENKYKQQIVN